ncbi:MAG: 30S ribosomal protein S4 [Candidatus Magasanikbacteria bacterium CG11_big_fil_rev_8_21_14_0_20_39_34]|uniref:Small ribosomal subunit protein uS4 n=1 Tax=Candidatus Magasanikbacteria bacterium CG11_big_fil_rev_8_21_14_0_20_39_34 TaxID=1974653 RepID=A0A2H0N5E1_9BACT|nr:MAG: 30S ribosomal protein S4 [Candidatus Magasanikbacteria bacterium CG11_big_fil_rev_8_21_14_0_20_39_34]
MGRYIGPKNKIARKFGVNLGLKTNASKVARRLNQTPGVQGVNKKRKSLSSFGKQLLEKQKAKFLYGLREQQFRKYVTEANRLTGDSGQNLLVLLERRLDNVIYRLGLGNTRAQARQMVSHGMFTVNGKKMNIPSYLVKVGDVIEVKANKKKAKLFENIEERIAGVEAPSWLTLDVKKLEGKVVSFPLEDDLEKVFSVQFIIEYYSTR